MSSFFSNGSLCTWYDDGMLVQCTHLSQTFMEQGCLSPCLRCLLVLSRLILSFYSLPTVDAVKGRTPSLFAGNLSTNPSSFINAFQGHCPNPCYLYCSTSSEYMNLYSTFYLYSADIAATADIVWEGYMGANIPAFLFKKAKNIEPSAEPRQQQLSTGMFLVQDMKCRNCNTHFGWSYLKAWNLVFSFTSQYPCKSICILLLSLPSLHFHLAVL